MMWLLNKFLCCCPLDTGAVIIGNICILLSFLSIYALNQDCDYREIITFSGSRSSTQASLAFLAAIILIITSFLLIIGAMKRQQRLIRLWLCVLAVYLGLACTTIAISFLLPETITLKEPILVNLAVGIIVVSYFWYCVHQFYRQLALQADSSFYNVISVNKV